MKRKGDYLLTVFSPAMVQLGQEEKKELMTVFDMPLSLWFQTERERLQGMTWPERLRHIWDYYKLHLLILAALIAGLVLWQTGRRYAAQPVVLSGVFVNVDTTQEGYQTLKAYAEATGRPEARSDVIETLVIDFTNPDPRSEDASLISQLDMMIAARELDYLICDEQALRWYAASDALLDLRELFPEAAAITLPTAAGEEKTVGNVLRGSAFDRQYGFRGETVYFAVPANAPHAEELASFWQMIG